ncbi:MAG: hypothetical protein ABL927_11820, partial [Bdellovibrionales bacterium]
IKKLLPKGLALNQAKKQVVTAQEKVNPKKTTDATSPLFTFDYLGYSFLVREPQKNGNKKNTEYCRSVTVDIAEKKVMRLKTRIARSFNDFGKTGNFGLLNDRIRYLTKNFSVYNPKVGGKKIAGIYHSYPLVSDDAQGLKVLDNFLRNAVLSNSGRIFSKSSLRLTAEQKRKILAHSFVRGHREKSFVYFSGVRIKEIQECWKN